jgi:hypothetical protein
MFVTAMTKHGNYEEAHNLLAVNFHSGSTSEWQAGEHLPLSLPRGSSFGGTTVAYSDAAEVGVVVSVNEPGNTDTGLVALNFKKIAGDWHISYVKQGHSSTYVDAANFAPPGFLPGSHRETTATWLILGLGLVGIITLVALLDWRISRPRKQLA